MSMDLMLYGRAKNGRKSGYASVGLHLLQVASRRYQAHVGNVRIDGT